MSRWMILKKAFSLKKARPHFAINVYCNPEAEIVGEVLIRENTNIGKSRIISKRGSVIAIGRNTNIRDYILLYADESNNEKSNNLFIGNRVFISSDVEIYGPVVISDETFIGNRTMVINSNIGQGCFIEDNVLIKNVVVPPNIVIPSRSVIDSMESLNEVISNSNQGYYCEISLSKNGR